VDVLSGCVEISLSQEAARDLQELAGTKMTVYTAREGELIHAVALVT
jgi:hypothetical protein